MRAQTWAAGALLAIGVFAAARAMPAHAQDEDPAPADAPAALTIFDFEDELQEWGIPEWAETSEDYVGKSFMLSQETASHGRGSVQLLAEFPGGGVWTGAYAEVEMRVTDWRQFSAIAVDVYAPPEAPPGLLGRIILTVGEQWTWTEMNRGRPLSPGHWTTMTANLKPGSMDWKFFPEEMFRHDVRKIGLRVESDKEPDYTGPIFFDHVRLVQ